MSDLGKLAIVCRSLNSNKLTSVPAALGRLEQLSRLSLHINALTGAPGSRVHARPLQQSLSQCEKQGRDLALHLQ